MPLRPVEHVRQTRQTFVAGEAHGVALAAGEVVHRATIAPIGNALEGDVVAHDDLAARVHAHVELDALRALGEREIERCKGILRSRMPRAAVTQNQRPIRRHRPTRPEPHVVTLK